MFDRRVRIAGRQIQDAICIPPRVDRVGLDAQLVLI